jgi:subtilisin family serine protease
MTSMTETPGSKPTWGQWAVFLLLSTWLAVVPIAITVLLSTLNNSPPYFLVQLGFVAQGRAILPDRALDLYATVLTLGVQLLVFVPLYVLRATRSTRFARKRKDDFLQVATTLLIAVALFQTLNSLAALPFSVENPVRSVSADTLTALLRLALVLPFLLFGLGWVEARWQGVSFPQAWRRVGLRPWLNPSAQWLALGIGAVIIWPWVLFGSLGGPGTTAANLLQALPIALNAEILFRGFALAWLWRAAHSRNGAAIGSLILFVASQGGAALPLGGTATEITAAFGVPMRFISALFLGLLTMELTIRAGGSIWPAVMVHYIAAWFPLAFIDARSHGERLELSHLWAWGWALVAIAGLGLALVLGRLLMEALRGQAARRRGSRSVVMLGISVLAWLSVVVLYVTQGAPGFHRDGFLILLEDQADLSRAASITDPAGRRAWVYQSLVETAERSQAPFWAELDRQGVEYRPHYLINMIEVLERPGLRHGYDGRQGVSSVLFQPGMRLYPRASALPGIDLGGAQGVEWNVRETGADQVWDWGYTGQGVIVGDADTGVDWGHPALKNAYLGWDGVSANHNYAWYDPWDERPEPWDDSGHGTHTIGTVVGRDGENRIGMAPGAKWIACRNMRHGMGNPGSYVGCMEFLLAPFPLGGDPFRDGDPARGAHVVNNSWGCPAEEGCEAGTLRTGLDNLRAAGQMMVVSAGNEGPACSTVQDPPAIYDSAFSVGAVTQQERAAGFSSRGPVTADGSHRPKPDLVAPGVEIRSSVPDGYASMGGTSMAGPHVAGAVALLWSAEPGLVGDVDRTEALLIETALPLTVDAECASDPLAGGLVCGCDGDQRESPRDDGPGVVPNMVYGWGQVDVWAAVQRLLEGR